MVADEERRTHDLQANQGCSRCCKGAGVKLGGDRGNLPAVNAQGRVVSLATRRARAASRAADLAPIIVDLKAAGATSLGQIAAGLNARGIKTARGGGWSALQVGRILERAA
jgi:hypothetical protein